MSKTGSTSMKKWKEIAIIKRYCGWSFEEKEEEG